MYERNEKEIKKINSVPVLTTPSNLFRDQIPDSFVNISNDHTVINTIETIIKVTGMYIRNTNYCSLINLINRNYVYMCK